MGPTSAQATIRIDAETSQAISGLRSVSRELNNLVPGGNAVSSVFERIQGGFLQLIQGVSRNIFKSITSSMSKMASAGINVAKTIEMSRVAFDNLLESGEDVDNLLLKIQEDASKTPFDVDALTLSTQKIALITKNGAVAEKTILSLGKALAAGGRGTAELNRMATNLQQIGQNAKATERDLREFGNAGIDIVGIVTEFSDEFKQANVQTNEARDWLKSIDNPFPVIVNALNNAGDSVEGFANIYEDGAQTIGQAIENMSDSVGIFSYRVMEQSKVLDSAKNILKQFQDGLFLNRDFTAHAAQAIAHLIEKIDEMKIVQPIIQRIQEIVSAFASGQFDNVIVFFKNLFNAISQFSGIKVVSNFFKTLFDLFSDNHTAEEVARVATQLGNLIRVFLELKMMDLVSNYAYNLTNNITTAVQSIQILTSWLFRGGVAAGTFGKSLLGTIGVVGALVAAIAIFSNISGAEFSDVLNSIISGIGNFFKILGDAAKQMLSFGWNLIAGLYNGIVEGFNAVIGKIREMAQAIINTFAQVFQIHSPSKVMKDYIGRNIDEGIAVGIKQYYGTIINAAEEVMEELVSLQADYVNELGDFGALDLVQQVNVYRDFAKLYREGTRARLEMDEKIHSAETSIVKEMIDLIEDFNTAYDKAFKKAKDYYDMFEYTQTTLTRTTKSVIEGLNRQNDNMIKYYNNIYRMSKMGFNDDFMSYIYEQGMDAASEVAGLADATAEQIEEINKLWETRGEVAGKIATLNTKKLKEDTITELDYLQTGLRTKVLDYYDSGTYLVYNFARGIYDMMPRLEDAVARVSATASKAGSGSSDDLNHIDTSTIAPTIDGMSEVAKAAERMNIELMDTNDIFSFMKNLLSGMPWWVWAGVGIKAVLGVAKSFSDFRKVAKGARTAARAAGEVLRDGYTRVTEITNDWSSATSKAAGGFIKSGDKVAGQAQKTTTEVSNGYRKVVTETQKATRKVNDITYSSASQQGANLLRPFKTFNTKVKGFTSSITNTIKEFLNIIFDSIKHVITKIAEVLKEFVNGVKEVLNSILKAIGDTLKTAVKTIGDVVKTIVNTVLDIVRTAVKGILKIIEEAVVGIVKILKKAAKGIGEAVRELLKPISDATLLKGVAVLGGLAVVILVLAEAGREFDKVSWEGLGKLAVVTAGLLAVAYVMQFLGSAADKILMGALAVAAAGAAVGAALAAIGGGLWVLSWSLAETSRFGAMINLDNIWKIVGALWIISGNLSASLATNIVGALSGLFGMAEGGELVVIANCLAEVSSVAENIRPENVEKIALTIKRIATTLSIGIVSTFIGMFSGAFAAAISEELVPIAKNLSFVSAVSKNIDERNIRNLIDVIVRLGGILTMSTISNFIGMFSAEFAAVIADRLVPISRDLSISSKYAKNIRVSDLRHIAEAIPMLGSSLMMSTIENFVGAYSSKFAAIVSRHLVPIAQGLAIASKEARGIDFPGIVKLETAIAELRKIDFGNAERNNYEAVSASWMARMVRAIQAIVDGVDEMVRQIKQLHEKLKVTTIVPQVQEIRDTIQTIGEAFSANFAEAAFKNWSSGSMVGTVNNINGVLNQLDDILLQLKRLNAMNEDGEAIVVQLREIQTIITRISEAVPADFIGSAFKNWASGNLVGVAQNMEKMLESVGNMTQKLQMIHDDLKDGADVCPDITSYIAEVQKIVEAIDGLINGDLWKTWDTGNKAASTSNIAQVAENTNNMLTHVHNICKSLRDFAKEGYTDIESVNSEIGNVQQIIQALEKIDFGNTNLENLRDSASTLGEAAGNLDGILGTVQSMCHKMQEFRREEYTDAEAVADEVSNVSTIVHELASIKFVDEEGNSTIDAGLAEKAETLSKASKSFDEILGYVKGMCDKLQSMYDMGLNVGKGGDNDITQKVKDVEKIVQAIEQINIDTDKDLGDMASKAETVAKLSENLEKVITATGTMIDSLKTFTEKYAGTTVEEQVKKINEEILAPLLGGKIGDKKYKGISIPFTLLTEADVQKLGIVKQALDKISEIAGSLGTIEDVSQRIVNVEQIVEFIKNTMSQIPSQIAGYNEDFKNQGIGMAQAFINGWTSKVGDGGEAAHLMQDTMWNVIENKMGDEANQGRWLAQNFLNGWMEKVNSDAHHAGHMMQDGVWRGVQDHMGDEWNQGRALSDSLINGIWSKQSDWWWTGDEIIAGIAGGINRNMWQISEAAGNISDTAILKLKQLLDIDSPSKVMAELGGYVAEGFANGINDSLNEVEAAGEALANAVMGGYNDAIEPIDLTAFEARAEADRLRAGYGSYSNRTTSVVQNNNIYNNMDMSQALSQIAWEVSRS